MTPHAWHLAFGGTWETATVLLVLTLMVETDFNSRAETVQIWWTGFLLLCIATGLVGRALTPGAFWHS